MSGPYFDTGIAIKLVVQELFMHVAAARLLGSSEFVSTDQRQLAAAAACRLKVIDLGKGEV